MLMKLTPRPPTLPTTGFFTTMSPDYGEGSGIDDDLGSGDGDYHFSGKNTLAIKSLHSRCL